MVRVRRLLTNVGLLLRDLGRIAFAPGTDGRSRSALRRAREVRDYGASLVAVATGDMPRAIRRTRPLLAAHPSLWWGLRIESADQVRHGELTASLATTRRLRAIADTPLLARRERDLVGRLEETDPDWLPQIPGDPVRLEPRAANLVMHLLKVSLPDRQSGYTIRSQETLQAQVGAGLDPFVVTPYGYPPNRATGPAPVVEVVNGIKTIRVAPGAPTDDLTISEQLSRTAALAAEVAIRERPAIIHAASGHRGYDYALVGMALKARLGRPLVYEVRGFLEASWTADEAIAQVAEHAELTRLRYATEMRAMTAADGIATLGIAMRDELVERGIPADKIVVVPNGIDPLKFGPTPPDPALRSRYGLDGRWVFGYISNMDHFREGHAVLIQATARMVAAGRNVACLLVGDGKLREELEAQVAAAGLRKSVIFTGRVPHDTVRAHYALLDAFVVARVPDRAARFTTPLKPYEAMAMGLPVVVSDLPALTEIAARDERGLVFPTGDAAALEATLNTLMDRPELASRIAEAGRAWVVAERTWAANGARYRDLYRSILERTDPGLAMAPDPSLPA